MDSYSVNKYVITTAETKQEQEDENMKLTTHHMHES
jgi:hypothetical protein